MKYLITLISVIWITSTLFSQSGPELMINGGFEIIDITIPVQSPYPQGTGPIYLAPPWDNIAGVGTCDVHHSGYQSLASVGGVPHSGDGNGRFIAPIQAYQNEACVGKTLQLNSGVTYIISFWIRKDLSGDRDVPIGIIVSEQIPQIDYSPFNSSHIPNFSITPTNTQYVKASFCFTAQNSVEHYVSFAPWESLNSDESVGFYLDDVSVVSLNNGTALQSANLNISQTLFCSQDVVTVDGTQTLNETGYVWEIYRTDLGYEQLQYSSGEQIGEAGVLNLTTILGFGVPGTCFRVYLTALGICSDVTSIDFCYEDPNINFLNGTNYLCEGVPTDLTVSGDNGWTYTWSTGASGVGLKTIQVTPTGNSATYSVNVVTALGCSVTTSITFNVFSSNNVAPWMNGINGSGEYIIYVNQGDIVNFNSNLFNDNANENVNTDANNGNIPLIFSQIIEPSILNNQTLSFYWNTGFGIAPNVAPGIYEFTLTSNDGNQCDAGINTFTFTIVIICDQCPMCVYYEDRGLTPQTPLPAETKAGKCIEAGFSQAVSTGGTSVLFQAGVSIDLGPFFTAEPGFVAQIDPSTCVTDCEDCCLEWVEFTYDPILNYVNPADNDPTNDIWQVTDMLHPYCAYNAKGFNLQIWEDEVGSSVILYETSSQTSQCCNYVSPSPDNPISHASIWWDFMINEQYYPGTHGYVLWLTDCNGNAQKISTGFIDVMPGLSGMGTIDNPISEHVEISTDILNLLEERKTLENKIELFPNPTNEKININGFDINKINGIQFYDENGKAVSNKIMLIDKSYDISKFQSGAYYVRIYIGDNYALKKFIKL